MQPNIKRDIFYCPKEKTSRAEKIAYKAFHKTVESLVPDNIKVCAVVEKSDLHSSTKINLGVVTKTRTYNVEASSKDLSSLLSKTLFSINRLKSKPEKATSEAIGSNLSFLDSTSFTSCPIESSCHNKGTCPLKINRKYKVKRMQHA